MKKLIRYARYEKGIERWALFVYYGACIFDSLVFICSLGVFSSTLRVTVVYSEWYEKLTD